MFKDSQTKNPWKSLLPVTKITYNFFWWGLFLFFKQVYCYFCCILLGFSILSCIFCVSSIKISSFVRVHVSNVKMLHSWHQVSLSGVQLVPVCRSLYQSFKSRPKAVVQQKSWQRDGTSVGSTPKDAVIAAPSSSPWLHLQPTDTHVPFIQFHRQPGFTVALGFERSNLYRDMYTSFKQVTISLIAQNAF